MTDVAASQDSDPAPVERSIREIGTELAAAFPSNTRHPLRALDARAMDLASTDQELKAALFRFVDVTPACRSLDDLARHLREFLREVPDAPPPLAAAMRISDNKAARVALGAAAAAGVRHMAHRFIIGETPASALGVLRDLWNRGVASSVDLLGEATVTQPEADRYAVMYPDRAVRIRAAGGLPADLDFGAREPELVPDIVHGTSPILLALDRQRLNGTAKPARVVVSATASHATVI